MITFGKSTLVATAFVGCVFTPILSASPIIGDLEFSGRSSTMRMGEFRNVMGRSSTVSGAVVSSSAAAGASAGSAQGASSSSASGGSASSTPVVPNALPVASYAFSAPSVVTTTVQASTPTVSLAAVAPLGSVSLAAAVDAAAVDNPEPSTVAMLLVGAGFIAATARSRRKLVRS